MALCGVMWQYVAVYGVMWRYVALCGVTWRYVALCGLFIAFCGDIRRPVSHVAISGVM